MASILGLITFLALFLGGQLLINRFRGRPHCGGCGPERGTHGGRREADGCCGHPTITSREE